MWLTASMEQEFEEIVVSCEHVAMEAIAGGIEVYALQALSAISRDAG